jgi:hypothetical protein
MESIKDNNPNQVQLVKYRENIRHIPLDELMEDHIHINASGIIPNMIAEEVHHLSKLCKQREQTKPMSSTSRREEKTTTDPKRMYNSRNEADPEIERTVYVDKEMTGLVIGQGGRNLKKLAEDHMVRIEKVDLEDESKFTVTGTRGDTDSAIKLILARANKNVRKEERNERNSKNTACKFYQKGNCKKGDDCDFNHHKSRSSRYRSRSPRENQRWRPVSRSRSPEARSQSPVNRRSWSHN